MKAFLGLLSFVCPFVFGSDIALLYTFDGKGDFSFNDSAYEGVKRIQKDFKGKIKEITPRNNNIAEKGALNAIKEDKVKMIIALSFQYEPLIKKMAEQYPDVKFVIIDSVVEGKNIASYVFKEQEGSFLAGYMAGKFSKTGKLGYVGGMPIPPLKRFEEGFAKGAQKANPKVELFISYMDEKMSDFSVWNDPVKAKALARKHYAQGVDIIYAVAGGSGLGVFEAAKETQKFAIGVDSNQNALMPGFIITSMMKRMDNAVYHAMESFYKNSFQAKTYELGVKEGGVELAIDEHTRKIVDEKIIKEIEEMKKNWK